jgi:hypothetical protein
MIIKKSIVSIVIFFCLAMYAFGSDGVMSGQKNVKVVQTVWFDIIYPEGSAQTAALLAENADRIYGEICSTLKTDQWARFPVVITPAQDEFNAYFTAVFYNHIVMYDTPSTESMAVFSNQFLSTFRHELTHAVTFNMKNKFWRTIGAVFGDAVNPAELIVTASHTEGAAVSFESMGGEGRLNNPYNGQSVQQSKLEELFPDYADIYGARDRYPLDGYYYFGGAFDAWLQKTYGMEKYAAFWYDCVNLKTIHQSFAFKAVYGIPLRTAWKEFRNSVQTPAINPDPVKSGQSADFFTGTHTYSAQNQRGSLYSNVSSSRTGLLYTDRSSNSVWFSAWDVVSDSYQKAVKLFTVLNMTRATLSADGRFCAVSSMDRGHAVPKSMVRIYGMSSHHWYMVPLTGIRDAAIVGSSRQYYLSVVKTFGQQTSLCVYELILNENNDIAGIRLTAEAPFPAGDIPFSPVDGGDRSVVYLYKTGLSWSIREYFFLEDRIITYTLPYEHLVLRSVSSAFAAGNKKSFLFSWAKSGGADSTLPRLGILSLSSDHTPQVWFQPQDFSGGVYNPVMLTNGLIAYSGHFYEDWRLLAMSNDTFSDTGLPVTVQNVLSEPVSQIEKCNVAPEYPSLADAKPYHPLKYYSRGLLLPWADVYRYTYNSDDEFSTTMLPLGVSYASSNPWSSGIVELAAGYNPSVQSGALHAVLQGGTATSLFSYTISGQAEFDGDGFRQTMNSAQVASAVPVGTVSYLVFSDTVQLFEGQSDANDPDLFVGRNTFTGGYTNIHKTGPGSYEFGGFALSASHIIRYRCDTGASWSTDNLYQDLSPAVSVQLPGIVPWSCRSGYTYNFPIEMNSVLFPGSATFLKTTGTVTLFGAEIQRALPVFSILYAQRYRFLAGYVCRYTYSDSDSWDFLDTPHLVDRLCRGDMTFYDSVSLIAQLVLAPNYGMLASASNKINLSTGITYRMHKEPDQNQFEATFKGTISY